MVLWRVEMEVADPEGPERSGRIAHGLPTPPSGPMPRPSRQEDIARVPTQPDRRSIARHPPGRVRHRADRDAGLVRRDRLRRPARSSGCSGGSASATRGSPSTSATTLDIELDLTVAYGVPVAEVARQVDSAVRYALRKALGREVRRLTIHIDGLRFGPGGGPPSVAPRRPERRRPTRPRRQRDGRRLMARRACDGAGPPRSVPGGRRQPRGARRRDQRAQRLPGPRRRHRLEHVRDGQGRARRGRGGRRPAGRTDRRRDQLRGADGRARQLGRHHQPDLPRAWPRVSAARAGSTASTWPTPCR